MFRIVEVGDHAADFYQAGGNFIAEMHDVNVFSVGCLAKANNVMVAGLSSGYYDANVKLQLSRYLTADGLKLPQGDEVDEAVLLWGDSNFGHWIFTYLNRLPLLFMKPQLLEKPLMVLDTTPKSYLRWLNLMGFHNWFLAKDGTRVKKLWVPSVVHYRDENQEVHVSADAVHTFRHLLVKNPGGTERIYLSRANAQWRKPENEDELVEVLARHGVRRVFMENMTAEEQLALIADCELVVSVLGGSSPITMLAPRTCRILEISLPGVSGVFGSKAWAQILGQPFKRIDGVPREKGINSNFTIDTKAIDECLRNSSRV